VLLYAGIYPGNAFLSEKASKAIIQRDLIYRYYLAKAMKIVDLVFALKVALSKWLFLCSY